MTYIAPDGSLYGEQPWGLHKVTSFFWAVVDCIIAFFITLIPGMSSKSRSNSNFRAGGGSRSGWGGGGGGGGGGGSGGRGWFGGGSDRPRRPPPPSGPSNVRGMDSIRPPPGPPPTCGSCCG